MTPPFLNLALVAHVDHGKTTLVDAMLAAILHRDFDTQHLDFGFFADVFAEDFPFDMQGSLTSLRRA